MKRIRITTILIALAALGLLAFAIFRNREPRYQGRTLSEWIRNAPWEHLSPTDTDEEAAARSALKHMAPEAIPILLKWAQAENTPLRKNLTAFINYLPFLHPHIKFPQELNNDAMVGFELLGTNSTLAWPTLIKLSQVSNKEHRIVAINCLFKTRPPKETVEPLLLKMIQDPDRDVQIIAAREFRHRFPQDAQAAGL